MAARELYDTAETSSWAVLGDERRDLVPIFKVKKQAQRLELWSTSLIQRAVGSDLEPRSAKVLCLVSSPVLAQSTALPMLGLSLFHVTAASPLQKAMSGSQCPHL